NQFEAIKDTLIISGRIESKEKLWVDNVEDPYIKFFGGVINPFSLENSQFSFSLTLDPRFRLVYT
ncbi:MAG: hypothetical protein Q8761_02955, partial [Sweet potato little leaf phytoplasma]|nr:hypothetical protein [Sweet potato little leaf phytoplasma]